MGDNEGMEIFVSTRSEGSARHSPPTAPILAEPTALTVADISKQESQNERSTPPNVEPSGVPTDSGSGSSHDEDDSPNGS